MAQPCWLPEDASPKFRQALELLIQVHVEQIVKKPTEEPISLMSAAVGGCKEQTNDSAAVPRGNVVTLPVVPMGRQGGAMTKEVSSPPKQMSPSSSAKSKDDDAPKGAMVYLGSLMGVSIDAHGHSNEVAMFGNVKEQLKDKQEIDEFEYDVANYYHTTGFTQSIARSDHFGHLALLFICANAVYLGIDSDNNKVEGLNDADLVFIICENIFCLFFTFEVLVRFLAFRSKRDCLRDIWFKFDSLLVCIMVMETWILFLVVHVSGGKSPFPTGPMKLLRLLKLARLVRILRSFPELMTMVKGMVVATKPVSSSMALLIGIIYVFGITMHLLCKDDEELYMYWGTVGNCMLTLTANGTLGDSIGTIMRGINTNAPALCSFCIFVILSAVTITNMLVGVLCEVVSHVADAEKEYNALSKLKKTLLVMLKELDQDGSGDISKDELMHILDHEDALEVLEHLEIDVKYFVDLLDMIYENNTSRTVAEIMQLLLDNQGQRTPVLKDIVYLHNFTRWSIKTEIKQGLAAIDWDIKRKIQLEHQERNQLDRDINVITLTQIEPETGPLQKLAPSSCKANSIANFPVQL